MFGTTCESLVHTLGHKGPRITKELFDIVTSHASGGEAVGTIFYRSKGKVRRDEDATEGPSNCSNQKKNEQQHRGSLVAAAKQKGGRAPAENAPDHFKKLLKGLCPNHTFPIKHLYKDYTLIKRFLSDGSDKGN